MISEVLKKFMVEVGFYFQKAIYSALTFIAIAISAFFIIFGGIIYNSYIFFKRKYKSSHSKHSEKTKLPMKSQK